MKFLQMGLLVDVICITVWPHLYWHYKAKSYDPKQRLWTGLGYWASTGSRCFLISALLLLALLIISSDIIPFFTNTWIAPAWISLIGIAIWMYLLWWGIRLRKPVLSPEDPR